MAILQWSFLLPSDEDLDGFHVKDGLLLHDDEVDFQPIDADLLHDVQSIDDHFEDDADHDEE